MICLSYQYFWCSFLGYFLYISPSLLGISALLLTRLGEASAPLPSQKTGKHFSRCLLATPFTTATECHIAIQCLCTSQPTVKDTQQASLCTTAGRLYFVVGSKNITATCSTSDAEYYQSPWASLSQLLSQNPSYTTCQPLMVQWSVHMWLEMGKHMEKTHKEFSLAELKIQVWVLREMFWVHEWVALGTWVRCCGYVSEVCWLGSYGKLVLLLLCAITKALEEGIKDMSLIPGLLVLICSMLVPRIERCTVCILISGFFELAERSGGRWKAVACQLQGTSCSHTAPSQAPARSLLRDPVQASVRIESQHLHWSRSPILLGSGWATCRIQQGQAVLHGISLPGCYLQTLSFWSKSIWPDKVAVGWKPLLVASQMGFANLKVVRKRRIPFVVFLRGVSSRGSAWTALPWVLVPMLGDTGSALSWPTAPRHKIWNQESRSRSQGNS